MFFSCFYEINGYPALTASQVLPRLKSDGSLLSRLRFIIGGENTQNMSVSYPSQGCRKCPYTDKSRPHRIWTSADLLLVYLLNFLHSGTPNKSQTRKSDMSWIKIQPRFGCKITAFFSYTSVLRGFFWIMAIFFDFLWKRRNNPCNPYVLQKYRFKTTLEASF